MYELNLTNLEEHDHLRRRASVTGPAGDCVQLGFQLNDNVAATHGGELMGLMDTVQSTNSWLVSLNAFGRRQSAQIPSSVVVVVVRRVLAGFSRSPKVSLGA